MNENTQRESLLSEFGLDALAWALLLSLAAFCVNFAVLFDYSEYGVTVPFLVTGGLPVALCGSAGLLLAAVTLALLKIKLPKFFTAAGLLLAAVALYTVIAILVFQWAHPIEEYLTSPQLQAYLQQ